MGLLPGFLALFLVGLTGCTTSASFERLEKQNKLLEIELENKEHALKSAQVEVDLLRDQLQQVDSRLQDVTHAGDDKIRSIEAMKKEFARERAKNVQCQTLLSQVKEHLESGKLNSRLGRQQFIQTLTEWESQASGVEASTH